MGDFREKELHIVGGEGIFTFLKGGLYICTVRLSEEYRSLLAGNFNPSVGLSGDTLIKLGNIVNEFESERKRLQQEAYNKVGL